MRAMVLEKPGPIESSPLVLREVPDPAPGEGEVRVRVEACAVCRTDLHVVEGDLPPVKPRIIPGHQVVGIVERLGAGATRFAIGDRVGIAWLRWTDGVCRYCKRGDENLCPHARFTGYTDDGGYAELAVVAEKFAYALPADGDAVALSPLLCAGIIGFRALRRAELAPGRRLGIYGFGSSAHIAIQIANYWKCPIYVMTRDEKHRQQAMDLGATWVGESTEQPPETVDSAILFAPVGELAPPAMEALDMGGTLAIAGIHLTDIPPLNYEKHLFHEKNLRSVTANTRADGEELLRLGGEIPLAPQTTTFRLEEANEALRRMKHDAVNGTGVLVMGDKG